MEKVMSKVFVLTRVGDGADRKVMVYPVKASNEQEAIEAVKDKGGVPILAFTREIWFLIYEKWDMVNADCYFGFKGMSVYDARSAAFAMTLNRDMISDYIYSDSYTGLYLYSYTV